MTKHILTIAVEEYFHVAALRRAVQRKHWDRLDPRLDANLTEALDLLDLYKATATFFVFGCIAEGQPEIVQRIVARGHEVASRGFWPRNLKGVERIEFLDDLHRAKEALEAAGSNRIVGYRAPTWIRKEDAWILEVLADEGYSYDSSVNPVLRRFSDDPSFWSIHRHGDPNGKGIWEFPISTESVMGVRVAISGGNYIRQLPHTVLSRLVARRAAADDEPVVFYFMPWELDKSQPHIQGISALQRVRHYRNLAKTRWVFERYLAKYQFCGIADHLGIAHQDTAVPPSRTPPSGVPAWGLNGTGSAGSVSDLRLRSEPPAPNLPEATLVVPIYNEAANITYLRRTLLDFRKRLKQTYRIHLVLVDDASTDETWKLLQENFGAVRDCHLVQRPTNGGVAGAILTGIANAPTEIVCTIDCDCSYDPRDLEKMIPLIENSDMVTASPYHPEGAVLNVPEWRLFLSKTLSKMYSIVLRERFYTYTSCCRVVRKSSVAGLTLKHGGFLGPAEMLIQLKLRGGRIIEYPATLESRLFGESKMRTARTIRGHLKILNDLVLPEALGGTPRVPPKPPSDEPHSDAERPLGHQEHR